MRKKTGLFIIVLCLLLALPLSAAAREDVPQEVLDSRDGVFRIVVTTKEEGGTGTGFAVGTEENYYVVTNYHVVYEMDNIYVMYGRRKFVRAEILFGSAARDIAVLQLEKPIPGVRVLPLETGEISTGMAVYALGYSGASDLLAQGFEMEYGSPEDILNKTIADKDSMTITDGIISTIVDSPLVGMEPSEGDSARLIQTNTAINRGNSGGPLLNQAGHVVGINTLGLSGVEWHIEAMNGSVHVDELMRELRRNEMEFTTANAAMDRTDSDQNASSSVWAALIWVFGLLGIGFLLVGLWPRIQKVWLKKRGIDLYAFERRGMGVPPELVWGWSLDLTRRLVSMGAGWDLNRVLTPGNIRITPKGMVLSKTHFPPGNAARLELYPGYSAPENYRNQGGEAAAVYFVGAVMATLLTGRRPEDSLSRLDHPAPLFGYSAPLTELINRATAPQKEYRIQTLGQFWQELEQQAPGAVYGRPAVGGPGPV